MSEYLLGMIGIVLFLAIITMILPQGKTAELTKSIARLACTVTVLSPIAFFFLDGQSLGAFFEKTVIETDDAFIEYSNEIHIESVENRLEQELNSRFNVTTNVNVAWEAVSIKDGQYLVEKLRINQILVLVETDEETSRSIQSFLRQTYQCEAEVQAWKETNIS